MHMSIILMWRLTMVSLVNPTAIELSVWIGLLGCGHPISIRVCSNGMNRAASSVSAVDAMMPKNPRMDHYFWTVSSVVQVSG